MLKKKQNLVSEEADAETVQNEDSNIHSDSDEDLVLEEFGDETNTESAASEDDDHHDDAAEPLPLVVRTRSGRYAGIGACSNYSDYKMCYFITVRYLHAFTVLVYIILL